MRILIIGKNSFVGTNFRKYSLYQDVDEVDSLSLKPEEFNFSEYDVIIHLAAIVHQTKKIGFDVYMRVNAEFPFKVAEKAKADGVKQFVFLSTVKVYGDYNENGKPWSEYDFCNPADSYGKSKLDAEHKLLPLNDENFVVTIIRTPLVYGPCVKANMLSLIGLVSRFPLLPFKRVNVSRSIVFVGNLAAFIDRAIETRTGGILLVQDQAPVTIEEMVKIIAQHLGKRVFLFHPGRLILLC
jgi:UDP-glucose 4-epimerase